MPPLAGGRHAGLPSPPPGLPSPAAPHHNGAQRIAPRVIAKINAECGPPPRPEGGPPPRLHLLGADCTVHGLPNRSLGSAGVGSSPSSQSGLGVGRVGSPRQMPCGTTPSHAVELLPSRVGFVRPVCAVCLCSGLGLWSWLPYFPPFSATADSIRPVRLLIPFEGPGPPPLFSLV